MKGRVCAVKSSSMSVLRKTCWSESNARPASSDLIRSGRSCIITLSLRWRSALCHWGTRWSMCTCEKKVESACIYERRAGAHMHGLGLDKHRHAKRVAKRERTRCRDEKYAGRAGPPDCEEVEGGFSSDEATDACAEALPRECEREESVGDWDMVGGEEHLHNPGSCPPPCTSHRLARCTVS